MTVTESRTLSRHATDFIDDEKLGSLLDAQKPDSAEVGEIIAKSQSLEPLTVAETSRLVLADTPELVDELFAAARELKQRVYGNRIVLFAPLYVGSYCINDCAYCGFRRSNPDAHRRTLQPAEVVDQVTALENAGHKRLILVFGEHPWYSPEVIAETVRQVYEVKVGRGEIRRVNINAAPLSVEGYRAVHEAGIGTYQVFQETYHHATYARVHPAGTVKADYLWRLDALGRAFEAGQDDVGLGALFGLADWRFEVLGLVAHSLHLQGNFGCGPHTISFPRLTPASGLEDLSDFPRVGDAEFKRLVAILRLAVPYTGLILTAREKPEVRREVMRFGVSQIDAGSRIELGGYTDGGQQNVAREQFSLGDVRSLDEVVGELLRTGYVPSWCTSCYRLGRTGEHFMEFAIPGFIKRYCTPNALTTLQEFLTDYASPRTRADGEKLIAVELAKLPDGQIKRQLAQRLEAIRTTDQRDLYF
jgi:2-iminoacetate synthase